MDENIPCKFFRNHSSTFPHIVLQTYAFDFIRVDVALAHESFIGSLNRYRYHWHAKGDVSRALAETILMADLNPLLAEELAASARERAEKEWLSSPPPQKTLSFFSCGLPL